METSAVVREGLRKHLERREQKIANRRNAILQQLQIVAETLPRRFPSIRRIVVIGSLAEPIFFSMNSDVDIVIAGLKNENYFDAYLLIEELMGGEELDLIREEEASTLLMRKIKEGIVLYDRQK